MKRLSILFLFLISLWALAQAPLSPPPMAVIGTRQDPAGVSAGSSDERILSDLMPKVRGKSTLIGGTIQSLDHVRERLVVHAFGGQELSVLLDGRTHVYRDGVAATLSDMHAGERVYLDTALAGTHIFARNVRVITHSPAGQSNGQVLSYDPGSGELTLRDVLAGEPAEFVLAPNTVVLHEGNKVSTTELRAGSLVALKFSPAASGRGVISEISILAAPGGNFVFAGTVSHLDLHTGLLVLVDPRDQKTYDIHFEPATPGVDDSLREGAEIVATANFDGTSYIASNIQISPVSRK